MNYLNQAVNEAANTAAACFYNATILMAYFNQDLIELSELRETEERLTFILGLNLTDEEKIEALRKIQDVRRQIMSLKNAADHNRADSEMWNDRAWRLTI
jgi:hypothetical protein